MTNDLSEIKSSKSNTVFSIDSVTPLRVTRSISKSSSTSSSMKNLDASKGKKRASSKPPLKFIKDPFSPQITEEQKEELKKRRDAKKSAPRKKYCATLKPKSRRI